jgi:rRNA maturation protein Nop10
MGTYKHSLPSPNRFSYEDDYEKKAAAR